MMPKSIEAAEKDIKAFLEKFLEFHTPCSIRVFVTMREGTNAFGKSWGDGDFYSMLGYVQEWLDCQREASRIETRKNNSEPADLNGGLV